MTDHTTREIFGGLSVALYFLMWMLFIPDASIIKQTHWTGNDPRLHSLMNSGVADLQVDEILVEAKKAANGNQYIGFSYYPQLHLEHTRRLMILEKQLERDWRCPRAPDAESRRFCGKQASQVDVMTFKIRQARADLEQRFDEGTDQNKRFRNVHARTWKAEYEKLKASDPVLREYEGYQTKVSNWDFEPLGWFELKMLGISILIAPLLLLCSAAGTEKGFRQLLCAPEQTAGTIVGWQVMYWKFPTNHPARLAHMLMERIAVMASFLFTFAPSLLMAQSHEPEDRKVDADHVLVIDTGEASSDPPVTIRVTSTAWSQYLTKNGLIGVDSPVVQSDFTVAWHNGWFANVWTSLSPNGKHDFGEELDGTVGWGGKHLSFGFMYIDLTPQFGLKGGDLYQPYIGWQQSFAIRGQTVTAYAELDRLQDTTSNWKKASATQYVAGLKTSWGRRAKVSADVGALWESGLFDFGPIWLGRFSTSIDVPLTSRLTVSPAKAYLTLPERNSERGINYALGSGISLH